LSCPLETRANVEFVVQDSGTAESALDVMKEEHPVASLV
jgi:hypothetical protein